MADNQSNDRTTGDWIHTSMKAAMSALPVVGSPAAEFFGFHVVAPASKRKDEWIRSFEERLVALESKISGLVEALPSNDAFITAALHATQVAMRSHQAEKLTALQNTVLNVAAGAAPDAGRQLTFLAWADAFTPAHMRFLTLRSIVSSRTTSRNSVSNVRPSRVYRLPGYRFEHARPFDRSPPIYREKSRIEFAACFARMDPF